MAMTKLFSAFTLAILAVPALSAQTKMVHSDFNATAFNELLDCVRNTSSRYEIAVHRGTVVIIPELDGTISLDSDADSGLGHCLDKYAAYLDLAIDNTRVCLDHGAVSQTQALATADWAESHGAAGMTMQNHTGVGTRGLGELAGSATQIPRQVTKNYYFSLGDMEDDDCSNYDQQNNVLDECINFGPPYVSIIFSNPNEYNSIRVTRWPHHKCAVDYDPPGADGRTVSVPANAESPCYNYPTSTFSFQGTLVPANCVGTCQ